MERISTKPRVTDTVTIYVVQYIYMLNELSERTFDLHTLPFTLTGHPQEAPEYNHCEFYPHNVDRGTVQLYK